MTNNDEYKGYFADCYVLTNNRTKETVNNFLETFVPQRKESADIYELPQYQEKTEIIFEKDSELIDYLVQNKSIPYSIYWRNTEKSDLRSNSVISFIHYADKFTENLAHKFPTPV